MMYLRRHRNLQQARDPGKMPGMPMKKILIVDDNTDNQYMLDVLLRSNGYSVTVASSGVDALEKANRELPDIVVSDILMPVMDGYALCQKWMADETLNTVPFVFYTATYTDPKDEEFALSLGAERFIKKPIDIDEFLRVILEVLNEDRTQKSDRKRDHHADDEMYYKKYNERLIHKLEQKMLQLKKSNAQLREEILERKKVEAALRLSLDEKETLLRELYHRTRNNMQIISSLLSIELAYRPEKKIDSLVADMRSRIKTMAMVHEKLYKAKNLSRLSLNEYILELCDYLLSMSILTKDTVSFHYDMQETKVQVEIAAPFGLVVHELVLNSLQHAFPDGRKGEIAIALHRTNENVLQFSYSDNGVGLPTGFNFHAYGNIGFEFISIIIENQLQGTVEFISGMGFRCLIRFDDSLLRY